MKYLITGISGFLGSNLAKRFPKRNIIIVPRDTLYDYKELKRLIEQEQPSYIFHLASYGNMAWQQEPLQIVNANVMATTNLLMASNEIDYKSFIFVSTSSVYGDKKHAMHETNSLEAKSYYACSKIAAEYLIRAHVERYEKPIVIARPFSIYGPGEHKDRFIPTAIRCIKERIPMKMASGMHDWIYIDDVIEALLNIQECIDWVKGKAVNIGTGQEFDNYEVLKHLCMIAGVDPQELPIDNITFMRSQSMWMADNTLLRSLGWHQKYSLTDGLIKCWEAYG